MTTTEAEAARKFSAEQRRAGARSGTALPDGSFPIKNAGDLRNAIFAFGRASNKPRTKAHIVKRAKALGQTKMLPKGWLDSASRVVCEHEGCERAFLDEDLYADHAEAVHTFDEIRRMVSEKVRATYGAKRDVVAGTPYTYAYVEDLTSDWVVFMVSRGDDPTKMYRAAYSISDAGEVTLGEPVEVVRRVVYDAVPARAVTS